MIVNIFKHSQTTSIAIIAKILCVYMDGHFIYSVDIVKESSNFFYNFLISPIKSNSILQELLLVLIFWQCIIMNK